MARYAILSPAFIGHLNPMIVLARALEKRGHHITFIAPIDAQTQAARAKHLSGRGYINLVGLKTVYIRHVRSC